MRPTCLALADYARARSAAFRRASRRPGRAESSFVSGGNQILKPGDLRSHNFFKVGEGCCPVTSDHDGSQLRLWRRLWHFLCINGEF